MISFFVLSFALFLSAVHSTYNPPVYTAPPQPQPTTVAPAPPAMVPLPPNATPQVPAPEAPKCNVCEPMQAVAVDNMSFYYQLCNFEAKYWIAAPLNMPLKLDFVYSDTMKVSVECAPDLQTTEASGAPIDFIHIREQKCTVKPDMIMLELDLYLPILHLRGTGATLKHLVSGKEVVLTF